MEKIITNHNNELSLLNPREHELFMGFLKSIFCLMN